MVINVSKLFSVVEKSYFFPVLYMIDFTILTYNIIFQHNF